MYLNFSACTESSRGMCTSAKNLIHDCCVINQMHPMLFKLFIKLNLVTFLQSLKQDISKARIRLLESLVKGPAGLDYLRNAFTNRYGAPTEAPVSLPLVQQWLSEVIQDSEQEWTDHLSSLSNLSSQGIPPSTLRAGGSIVKVATAVASAINAGF